MQGTQVSGEVSQGVIHFTWQHYFKSQGSTCRIVPQRFAIQEPREAGELSQGYSLGHFTWLNLINQWWWEHWLVFWPIPISASRASIVKA